MNVYNCCWAMQNYDKNHLAVEWSAADAYGGAGIAVVANSLDEAVSAFKESYPNRSLRQVYELGCDILFTPQARAAIAATKL